ncbi:MAG: hypothetical protein LBH06_04720, partial [Rikenellaceae bacterium]|nr:hypothetical protein [Rikenellaceae bacterium]
FGTERNRQAPATCLRHTGLVKRRMILQGCIKQDQAKNHASISPRKQTRSIHLHANKNTAENHLSYPFSRTFINSGAKRRYHQHPNGRAKYSNVISTTAYILPNDENQTLSYQ